jgi:hypothetical protein
MKYHEPDERWKIFGCADYEAYLKKYLVKGLFHISVPDDVKKSYEIIEHLMAHAWYHYPLYDEALNKSLRTFEIAVKQKAEILSIPTKTTNKKNIVRNRDLADLIKDICTKEPGKKQSVFLQYLRDLRNSFMHPDKYSYAGGIMYKKILLSVNIINLLFAPENFMLSLYQLNDDWHKKLKDFSGKALAYTHNDSSMLLHNLSFADVFIKDNEEIVLIYLEPVHIYTDEQRVKKWMPRPEAIELKNATIRNNRISGLDVETNCLIHIDVTSDSTYSAAANEFREYLYGLKDGVFSPYPTSRLHEIGDGIQNFHYRYFHSIC